MARNPTYPEGMYLPTATDEDKAVPVQVSFMVWVKRQSWEAEYSIDPTEPGYDFEDAVQDWVLDEVSNYGVVGGNWSNVTEVTE